MTHALKPPPPLSDLLKRQSLALFLDFDGTLVELAPTPDAIRVPSELAEGLAELAQRLDGRLALVTGRSLSDLEQYLPGLALPRAGSHGADRRSAAGLPIGTGPQPLPLEAAHRLREYCDRYGLLYEAKPHGGAIHYRARPDWRDPAIAFAHAMSEEFGLAATHGKGIVELLRPGIDKGGAVSAFMTEPLFAGATPVFIGDDLTDEHGIAAAARMGGFGIAVGERHSAAASYHLAGVAAVHQWLGL